MKDKFIVIEADTPNGPILMTDVTYKYATGIAGAYERGTYEKALRDYILQAPCHYFVDVGAAFGVHSFAMADRPDVRRVIAYEPHPIRYALLWWNAQAKEKLLPRMQFVTNHEGSGLVAISANPSGLFGMELGARTRLTEHTQAEVSRVTLDSLLDEGLVEKDAPIVIKIDVEGFEMEVLDGARRLMGPNTRFIVESHKAVVSNDEIAAFMVAQKYKEPQMIIDTKKNSELVFEWGG